MAILGVSAGCAPERECEAPLDAGSGILAKGGFVFTDDALLGKTAPELRSRLGPPCSGGDDESWLTWALFGSKVVPCVPTGRWLGVRFSKGKSAGYYVGDW